MQALADRVEQHKNPPRFDPMTVHRGGYTYGRELPGMGPATPAPQLTHHSPQASGIDAMVHPQGKSVFGPATLGVKQAYPHPEVKPDPCGPGPAQYHVSALKAVVPRAGVQRERPLGDDSQKEKAEFPAPNAYDTRKRLGCPSSILPDTASYSFGCGREKMPNPEGETRLRTPGPGHYEYTKREMTDRVSWSRNRPKKPKPPCFMTFDFCYLIHTFSCRSPTARL